MTVNKCATFKISVLEHIHYTFQSFWSEVENKIIESLVLKLNSYLISAVNLFQSILICSCALVKKVTPTQISSSRALCLPHWLCNRAVYILIFVQWLALFLLNFASTQFEFTRKRQHFDDNKREIRKKCGPKRVAQSENYCKNNEGKINNAWIEIKLKRVFEFSIIHCYPFFCSFS